jgi:multifunctional 2-oxoglutarate metabolism enzyme
VSEKITSISEHIDENFGANASYVEGLLARYRTDPNSVDEAWQEYFEEMLAGSDGAAAAKTPAKKKASPAATAESKPSAKTAEATVAEGSTARPLTGPARKIVENMEQSLAVPTATSVRTMPVKLLDENRRLINEYLQRVGKGKVSFTHLIAWAIVIAAKDYPQMNNGFGIVDGAPSRIENPGINLGIAIDIEKKDGSRSLLVPNIKGCEAMDFAEFFAAFNETVGRARDSKLEIADFQGTTITLTNPGTIGTVASNPRLMSGQSAIIATGAIEYPAEYQAMTTATLSQLGISKIVTLTSTYDHRVIQGAESGMFLARIHELLIGQHGFYDVVFAALEMNHLPLRWAEDYNPSLLGGDRIAEQTEKQANVLQLINAFRIRGHLLADIDPLNMTSNREAELDLENFGLTIWDLDREFITGGLHGEKTATLRKILDILRKAYCGKVGIEYRHIQSKEEKEWIRRQIREQFVDQVPLDADIRKDLLRKLIEAEQFEQFLHKKYLGQKRFSLEGCETAIPMLDQLVEGAAARGVEEIYMGMAHRGRLNVLSNIVGDPEKGDMAERIFTIFEGSSHPSFPADEGDVKYHQGAIGNRVTKSGNVRIELSCNPSHLEFVDPVVEGMTRARQDQLLEGEEADARRREAVHDRVLPVLLHGDAAFAGQGIVMETLQLANLRGYRTGGTLHIVINNQIGFTTTPEAGRSSIYSTDAAQITQTPIFHINGDDPEAAYRVIQIALDYRQAFNKDVVLDLVGFRRLGHNEGDEPSYTQPLMYARVKAHPGVRHLFAEHLIREGVIDEAELTEMTSRVTDKYEGILVQAKQIAAEKPKRDALPPAAKDEDGSDLFDSSITPDVLKTVAEKITLLPDGFNVNPKMVGQLGRRAKMGTGEVPMDWAFAEAIAFGSLVKDGLRVRLSGQDSGRGTFSQRHALMYDTVTGNVLSPLGEIRAESDPLARFQVFDSSLSENAVLGFEYGYSVKAPDALVMWEAQFGDFANGAQVIIDQYIAASEDKWDQKCRLVMLLPHGYEGQGPEHSSARLERFLQLCAENNLQVCYPTTPAQYFHLLRRQVKQERVRPLVVMTPKSLLRLPAAASHIDELTTGGFQPVIDDARIPEKTNVTRIVLCSGKVFYDLDAGREDQDDRRIALVRLEQFYPFPGEAVSRVIASYPNAKELVWTQEEPQNMGGWTFVEPRLREIKPDSVSLRFVGRAASASPATGSYSIHEIEQKEIVERSLTEDSEEISDAGDPEAPEIPAPAAA